MEGSENVDISNMSDSEKRKSSTSHRRVKMDSSMKKEIVIEIEDDGHEIPNEEIYAQKPLEVIDVDEEEDMEEEKIDTRNGGMHHF
jgi:hypothetical protein